MGPADREYSEEEIEEALYSIHSLLHLAKTDCLERKGAALTLTLRVFATKPGLARQLPGLKENLTSTLASLPVHLQPSSLQPARFLFDSRPASNQTASFLSDPRPASNQQAGFQSASPQPPAPAPSAAAQLTPASGSLSAA